MFRKLSLVLLLCAGVAVAQDSGTSASPGGVDSSVERADSASPAEMRTFAAEALPQVKEHVKYVQKLTSDAQSKSDGDLLECLVPKATSIQALEDVIKRSGASMIAALDSGKDGSETVARFHYRVIAVSLNRALSIRQAAETCDARSTFSDKTTRTDWSGGTGDEDDTIDRYIDDRDIGVDPPNVTRFIP